MFVNVNVNGSPETKISTLDDTDFGEKVDFCGGRKSGESVEKPLESD